MLSKHLRRRSHDTAGVRDAAEAGTQVRQEPEPLLGKHALGGLLENDEHAIHVASFVRDWTERGGPPGPFGIALSLDDVDGTILEVSCFTPKRLLENRTDNIPNLAPRVWKGPTECLRPGSPQQEGSIIVEGDELGAPDEKSRKLGVEHSPEDGAQVLRPSLGWAEG
jgi:hypothetical protein